MNKKILVVALALVSLSLYAAENAITRFSIAQGTIGDCQIYQLPVFNQHSSV